MLYLEDLYIGESRIRVGDLRLGARGHASQEMLITIYLAHDTSLKIQTVRMQCQSAEKCLVEEHFFTLEYELVHALTLQPSPTWPATLI